METEGKKQRKENEWRGEGRKEWIMQNLCACEVQGKIMSKTVIRATCEWTAWWQSHSEFCDGCLNSEWTPNSMECGSFTVPGPIQKGAGEWSVNVPLSREGNGSFNTWHGTTHSLNHIPSHHRQAAIFVVTGKDMTSPLVPQHHFLSLKTPV